MSHVQLDFSGHSGKVRTTERHHHSCERWFEAALEQGGYEIAGTTSPDFDGSYFATSSLNGDFAYTNKDGSGFLWWDNVDSWIVSAVLGTEGSDYFKRTNASAIGAYGNEGSATGTVTGADIADTVHIADRMGEATGTSFVVDAGNDDWGSWLQILGDIDTPADTGRVEYDFQKLQVTAVERLFLYEVQISFGASGAAGLSATTYTEFTHIAKAANSKQDIIDLQNDQALSGTKAWIRCKCPGQDTATFAFVFGLHEYLYK